MADVVRTRMFVTDITRWEEYGRAHQETFAEHPPATTLVEVSAIIDPDMLVEIEADAILGGRGSSRLSGPRSVAGCFRKTPWHTRFTRTIRPQSDRVRSGSRLPLDQVVETVSRRLGPCGRRCTRLRGSDSWI